MRRLAAAAIILIAATTASAQAPAPGRAIAAQGQGGQPVFKSGGVTVSLQATVHEASGRLVPDLSAGDFIILDNGRPQPLTVFKRETLPISTLILLDTSISMNDSIALLRDGARQFVAHMRPGDRTQFGAFNSKISWVRPFTSDRKILNQVLDYVGPPMVDYGTALWPAISEGLKEFDSVEDRRILLVFSDGEGNLGRYRPAISARASAANVMVYAITLKTEFTLQGQKMKSTLDRQLPLLSEQTGGGYFELTSADDLATTFARVAEELHHQYTLGFAAPELDGKTHRISVQLRGEGMTVRARRSYVATRQK